MQSPTWLVTGASGFIGRRLCASLAQDQIAVHGLSRQPLEKLKSQFPDVDWHNDYETLKDIPITHVVNLAGEGIADKAWNAARKELLWQSRVDFTEKLSKFLHALPEAPKMVISGSAIGYYGTGLSANTECSAKGFGFSADLCAAWEKALSVPRDTQTTFLRIGVVLGQGGMLKKLLPIYRLGLGGPIGSGDQVLSWIQRDDLIAMIRWIASNQISGVINATGPHPINQRRFAQHLNKALKRPNLLRTPALSMKLIYGEMAEELLLAGQTVLPERATRYGFKFTHPWVCAGISASLRAESEPWWKVQ